MNDETTPLSLKEAWENKYEASLKQAEDQIAKDLLAFKNNLKTIKAMNPEEFERWFTKWNFPQPMFDQVHGIFQREKAQAEAELKKLEAKEADKVKAELEAKAEDKEELAKETDKA